MLLLSVKLLVLLVAYYSLERASSALSPGRKPGEWLRGALQQASRRASRSVHSVVRALRARVVADAREESPDATSKARGASPTSSKSSE